MKAKSINWQPKVGEYAYVPGGPGNALYCSQLTGDDVTAIERGHSGYLPLNLELLDQKGNTLSTLTYIGYSRWSSTNSHDITTYPHWQRYAKSLGLQIRAKQQEVHAR